MSANLFGERYLGRLAAWHHLGKTFEGPMSASQAVETAGLLYQVDKAPLYTIAPDGSQLAVADRSALIRQPTSDDPQPRVFGIVGNDYDYVQNAEVARMLDPIAEKWPVETIGALGSGETVFMSLKTGGLTIAGEDYLGYFLFTDTLDGKHAAKMMFTPIRVVCQNTLRMAGAAADVSISLAHTRSFSNVLDWQMRLIADMTGAMNTAKGALEQMAETMLTASEVTRLLEKIYPYPGRPAKAGFIESIDPASSEAAEALYNEGTRAVSVFEYYCERADRFREAANGLYETFNSAHPKVAGTAYALYQAVVESADYREGRDNEAVSISALFGARASEKLRAWRQLSAV